MNNEYVVMDYEVSLKPLYNEYNQVIALYLEEEQKDFQDMVNDPNLCELFYEVRIGYDEWPTNQLLIRKIYETYEHMKEENTLDIFLEATGEESMTIHEYIQSFLSSSMKYQDITSKGYLQIKSHSFLWILNDKHVIEKLKERKYKVIVTIISTYKL